MKNFLAAVLLSVVMATQAAAYEVRLGAANVQMRDRAWRSFEGGAADALFNVGPWSFAHSFDARVAVAYKKVDWVFGGRLSSHEGGLRGIDTSLLIVEPEIGARRRLRLRPWADVYGQVLLSVPYARTTFEGRRQDHAYWAAFPLVTPGLGATVYPMRKQPTVGLSAEVGYSTPAPLDFRARNGIDPGTLNYGGLTYGLFVVYRSDVPPPARADTPPPVAPQPEAPSAMVPVEPTE